MGLEHIRNIKEQALEPKQKKVYTIPKISEKRKERMKYDVALFEADKEFYREHWLACPHKCECCGLTLPKEPLTTFFHHILPKAKYPQFRHTHENILVVCPACHMQIETNISKVPYAVKRRLEVEKLLLCQERNVT